MKLKSIRTGIILLVLLTVLSAVIMISGVFKTSTRVIGEMLPAFSLPLLHDESSVLRSESLNGQVTILNVWASWCVSCRLEHPLLMELSRDKSLNLYGVNYRDIRGDALKWLEFYGDPFRLTLVVSAAENETEFGAYGVPETYLIDSRGRVRYRHPGVLTRDVWQEEFLPLISHLNDGQ